VKKQLRIYLLTAGIIVLLTSVAFYFEHRLGAYADSVEDPDSWSMYRHDPQRTGYSALTAPDTNETKWSYNTTREIDSSPAVANGRLIVGVSDGTVLAFNATTGEKLWSYDTVAGSNSIWSSPAIDSGRVYIGTRNQNLYCLNASTGDFLWKYLTGGEIDSAPLVSNGRVYFGSGDGKLYCLDANDGSLIWNFTETNISVHPTPAIWNDIIFVGSSTTAWWLQQPKFYAINALTGVKIWEQNTTLAEESTYASPAVNEGKVFFVSSYNIYCLNASTGEYVWKTDSDSPYFLSFFTCSCK
jgi:outer membrane protein assembly factor BamB